MELSEKIKELREERNWSQKDLAAALNESPQLISQWEEGKQLPEQDRLIHLSLVFEVPLSFLTGDQTSRYDLSFQTDPHREAEKRKKEKLLLSVKLLGLIIAILLAIIVNMVWLRFLGRFLK